MRKKSIRFYLKEIQTETKWDELHKKQFIPYKAKILIYVPEEIIG